MTGDALRLRGLASTMGVSLWLLSASSAAAAVQVSASLERSEVEVGQQVILTVSIEGEARDVEAPKLPVLADFDVYGGGQSQRFSFVNGRVSAEHSFTYYLRPRRVGEFLIGPIEVRVDGKMVRAVPVELRVVGTGSAPAPEPRGEAAPSAAGEDDMFVTMTVDRDSVVVGEQIVLTFGFYRAVRMSAFESPEYTPPRTEGFWREDLPPERHATRVIRSRRYNVTEIQYALFPAHAGELVIGEAMVSVPDDVFGSLLRSRRRQGPRLLRTEPINVHVEPLPEGAPTGFDGTVASDLRLEADVDRRELAAGEALTLRIRLEGDGYLSSARAPQLEESDAFRVHDAGGAVDSRPVGGRLHGVRVVEKLVVPRQAGDLTLPPLRYVYYDTSRGEYVTLRTESIELRVTPSEEEATVFASGRKSEIELLARDIHHIRPLGEVLRARRGPLVQSPGFWALMALPGLLWAGSGQLARRRRRLLADPRRRRAHQALRRALRALQGQDPADRRVDHALRGYVADKVDRSAAGLTEAEVVDQLSRAGQDPALAEEVRALLHRCDTARFAPGASEGEELLRECEALLRRMEAGWSS